MEADEDLYDGEEPWTPDQPLSFLDCSPELPYWTCEFCLKREEGYEENVLKSIAREQEERRQRAEEARKRREHREAHERWLKEEIVPRPRTPRTSSAKVALTRTVCDAEGREITYSVTQETEHSEVFLRFGDEILAVLPPPYTPEAARLITAIYKNHRRRLDLGGRDVTTWETGGSRADRQKA